MRYRRATALGTLVLYALAAALPAEAQRRKKKTDEDFTQTLEVFPDPPAAVKAPPARLSFYTVPMSAKGLLSQQVRDGLEVLLRQAGRREIVKIRAFVAGTGDMRRVQAIVSETFTKKRKALPVLSVIQAGSLPLDGAQVQMEAWLVEPKPVNPAGLALISGQLVTRDGPLEVRVVALAEESLAGLEKAARAAGAGPEEMLRVSCFLSSLADAAEVRAAAARRFPRAQTLLAQTQRSPAHTLAECEGVARLTQPPAGEAVMLNPEGLPQSKAYSQVALVNAPALVLAGTQLAFRYTEADARLAFERLEKTLAAAGSSLKRTVFLSTYPLSAQLADLVRRVRFDYLDPERPPASTLLLFEGLPSMDGAFALEAVALPAASSNP
jgi:enamine deaminase RidA (YjgF/YER057c/UK114 family)